MAGNNPSICLSEIDEDRFGIRTAKAVISGACDIPGIMGFCERNEVRFFIVRCPSAELDAVHEMERLGFSLIDTLIYFSHDLKRIVAPKDIEGVTIRRAAHGDGNALADIAGESFRGYPSHYHADGRLEKGKCDEAYRDWAYRSCISRAATDDVFVAESSGCVVGFGTMCVNDEQEGEGELFAVTPSGRGRGIYRSIIIRCLNWCVERGLEKMVISTQITNLVSQKVWVRLGFEPSHSYYTFHKWFEHLSEGSSDRL